MTLLSDIVISLLIFGIASGIEEDKKYWLGIAEKEINEALAHTWNTNTARNVIVFVGDGMSPDTITASRIYGRGETGYLAWEKFPHVGLLKTYNADKQAPDSASTATALFGGVKTNYNVLGLDGNVKLNDCEGSLRTDHHVESIVSWAQAAGKSTGFVTTTRVTHATPAPLYAHSPNRKWECETPMPKNATNCKDIARQLIENEPGKSIKVIMGGGRQMLRTLVNVTEADPIDKWASRRKDGRDLIGDWMRDKEEKGERFRVVQNNEELRSVDYDGTDSLLGIFANGHMPMEYKRDKGDRGQPSLADMTVAALKILGKSEKGYLLVVEGGLIDYAHHRGHAAQALLETVQLSEAVDAALGTLGPVDDTLVVVTSDHTHSLAFNGNSARGADILGIAEKSKYDGIPYTTLSYSTGGRNNRAYTIDFSNNKSVRLDPTLSDTTQFTYSQQAAIITDEAHHGGGDVAVYARGPYAHLFHRTHEQNFVAYVIAYASKIGHYKNHSSVDYQWSTFWLATVFFAILMF